MMRHFALPSRRVRTGCSVLALATVLVVGATPASAQSFLGNGTVTSGTGTITTGVNTTNIAVTTSQTVIDWVPFDNAIANNTPIAFQNSGTTASFSGPITYAVLNRINPADSTRNISMNGLIQTVAAGAGGAGNGSIYFYSPGGFVIGGSAVINVGSLVLSASPITVNGSGQFITGANNSVIFGQASRPGAAITTNVGSQINATASDSYVAMVAPRVSHGGTINVNGSAALVAAEAATINFSPSGLFDIQVTSGTTSTTGVSTSGTITGAASTGATDIHRAYLVAVPKNTALTMLIGAGSNLGFNVAGAANVIGNTVVLSAGHDVSGGAIGAVSAATTAGALSNIQVTDSNFTSALVGEATGYAHLSAFNPMHFYSNVGIHADGEIWFSTQAAAGTIDVDGSLSLSTERYGASEQPIATSKIDLYNVNGGGRITVDGATTINTNAHGGWSGTPGTPGGDGTAGNVNVNASQGGTVELLGGLNVSADGYAGSAFAAGVNGGKGTGGNVNLYTLGDNSHLTITGATNLTANGYGGSGNGGECFSCNGAGGDGVGGLIQISPNDSATTGSVMTFNGNLTASANGYGGTAVTGLAGKGLGGTAKLLSANLSTLIINGNLSLQALGQGGYHQAGTGGEGRGGFAYFSSFGTATSGQVTVTGNATLNAGGTGGGSGGSGAIAGQGTGGTAYILAARDNVAITGNANVSAYGIGGNAATGTGGTGLGGIAYIRSDKVLTIGGLATLSTDGTGGSGASGGLGNAGSTRVYTNLSGASLTVGGVDAYARGFGGNATANLGGVGNGGVVELYYAGATTLTVNGDVSMNADGRGGASVSGDGADGTGGDITFGAADGAASGGTLSVTGNVSMLARGFGGDTNAVDAFGGTGAGGTIDSGGNAGTMTVTGSFFGSVLGAGGYSGQGTGGSGYGGNIWLDAFGASITIGSVDLEAQGAGGDDGSHGGYAEGGYAALLSSSSLVVQGDAMIRANATGGLGNSGDGGDAYGGDAYIRATNGTLTINGNTTLRAQGFGGGTSGSGETAGDGHGGNATVRAMVGGTINLAGTLDAKANGFGGDAGFGSSGGSGQGGDVRVQATAANASITVGGAATLFAQGWGAAGRDGTGGTVWVEAYGAPTASLDFQSSLVLNAGGVGGDSNGGPAGNGQGGETLLRSTAGSHISVGGDVRLISNAFGGYSYDFTAPAGNAIGGTARIETYNTGGVGGNIAIDGSAYVYARGYGGGANGAPSGDGGDGTGGNAQIITTLGNITIGNDAFVATDGYGGFAAGGIGGDGFGGTFTEIDAINGDITIDGYASVSASGFGGYGLTGGNGFGDGTPPTNTAPGIGGAHIYAQNGDIVIGGGASVMSVGIGGNGLNVGGNGGDGFGGWASITAQNSNLGPSSITIVSGEAEGSGYAEVNVDGIGGNGGIGASGNTGGNGGQGGTGTGGVGSIAATAGNGHVTIDHAIGYARGTGGYGGNGGNGDGGAGGNGGDGGNGVGGSINIGTISGNPQSGAVNNGVGDYGTITADSSARGGIGGNGNFGATNGTGGDGGDATGGAAVLLVRGSTVNVVSATLHADATGGGAGYLPGFSGFNGIGGDATVGGDGGIGVLVTGRYLIPAQRGTLNAGDISGTAIANSGIGIPNGNSRSMGGSGVVFLNGDGAIGSLDLLIGTGWNGSSSGVDQISVINGDVTIDGEFSFVTPGNLSLFANNGDMHSGMLTLSAGNFVFDPVPGHEPPSDRGTYFADSATITTGNNFVTSADLVVGSSLVIDAPGLINAHNFGIDGDLDLIAQSGDITANDLYVTGRADLDAFGAINLNIVEAGFFHAQAGGSFTSSDITSDSNIQIFAGDDVTLGELVAGPTADINSNKAIRIITDGSVLVGNILSAGGIDITALGSVTGGNVTTGDSFFTDALGAILFGDVSAGLINPQIPSEPFSVGLASGTSIIVGNVDATRGIAFVTPGTLTTGSLTTGTDVLGLVHGNMIIGDISASGRVLLADYSMFTDAGGTIPTSDNANPEDIFAAALVPTGGSITVNGPISAGSLQAAAGTSFSSGNIGAAGLIAISAGTSIGTGSIINTGNTNLHAGTSINVGAINSGAGAVSLITGTSFISGDIIDAGSIFADSGSDIFLGNLTAPGDIELVAAGDILVGNALAGESIDFDAGGYIDGGNMTAGDSVYAKAGGSVDLLDISAGIVDQSNGYDADYNVGILAGTTIDTGDISAFNHIGLAAEGDITTGNIDAGHIFLALGGGDMSFGSIDAGDITYLANFSMMALGGEITNSFNPGLILSQTPVASGGSIIIGGPVTTGTLYASAGTFFDPVNITSDHNIYIDAGTDIIVGNLVAGLSDGTIDSKSIHLMAGGSIDLGNAIAPGRIKFEAGGTVDGGNITSGDMVDVDADGAIVLGDISSGLVNPQLPTPGDVSVGILSKTSIQVGDISSAGTVGLVTLGALNSGDVNATGDLIALAGGNMTLGDLDIGGRVFLSNPSLFIAAQDINGDVDAEDILNATPVASGGSITTGTINAGSVQAAAGTTLNVGTINADGRVALSSGGAMQTQNITSGSSLRMTSGSTINGGNLVADSLVRVSAAGAVNVGNITIVHPANAAEAIEPVYDVASGTPVEVFGASIVTGNIATDGYVGLYTPGSLTVGTINAGHDVIALVGTNAAFGAIKTNERFLLGGYSMFAGLNGGETFNPALAFGATKAKTGGSATFGGSSTANSFQAYVGTDTTLQSLTTTSFALVDTGGMFTLNGTLNGNSRIISNDITINSGAAVNTGALSLVSRNATQTVVGDGVSGGGYQLSDAEFDRIHTPLSVVADTTYGAAAKMLIGDLTATVAGASLSGYDYEFATINGTSSTSVGSIKVIGDVTFTGLSLTDEVAFTTNRFELDAATGSVNLFGQGTTLSGVLALYAPNVWVASGDILTKLEANPLYAGRVAELNAPAAVQRPEGVLRAATFDIDAGEEDFRSLLVQNTGTTALPAGFVVNDTIGDGSDDNSDAPGSIDLVINGQLITPGGTLTGIAVRDSLIAQFGPERFVPGSTINGCVLVGPCTSAPPRVNTPAPTDVQLTDGNGLGDGLFGNEPDIAGEDDGDLSSPIAAPNPLFDSRPLDQSEDVNDPVSGAGNPSLYGNPDEDEETDEQKKAKKIKKGDGK